MALKNRTLFLRVRLYAVEQGDVLGEEAAVRHVCSFTLLYDENNLPHWILPKGEVSSLDDFVFYDFCMICFTGLRLHRPNQNLNFQSRYCRCLLLHHCRLVYPVNRRLHCSAELDSSIPPSQQKQPLLLVLYISFVSLILRLSIT